MNRVIPFASVFLASAAAGWMIAKPEPVARGPVSSLPVPPRPKPQSVARTEANTDPVLLAAMEAIKSATTEKERKTATLNLAAQIPDEAIEKWVAARIFKNPDRTLEEMFYRSVCGRFAALEPERYFRLAANNPTAFVNYADIRIWAANDYAAVIALADTIVDDKAKRPIMSAGLAAMAKVDPNGALAKLEKYPDIYTGTQALKEIAKTNPKLLLDWAEDKSDGTHSWTRQIAAQGYFNQDFDAALAWAKQQAFGKELIRSVISERKMAPAEIVSKVGQLESDWMNAILSPPRSPEYLEEWLNFDYQSVGLTKSQGTLKRMKTIVEIVRDDPDKAFAAIEAYQESIDSASNDSRRGWLHDMTEGFNLYGGEISQRWQATLKEEDLELLKNVVVAGRSRNQVKPNVPLAPAEAIHHYATEKKMPDSGFIKRWTASDLALAVAAVPTVEEGKLNNLYNLVDSPGPSVPFELQAAILAEAAKRKLDFGDYQYVRLSYDYAEKDPQAAGAWSIALPQSEVREYTIRAAVTKWHEQDAPAALRWIESLPESDRLIASKGLPQAAPAQ